MLRISIEGEALDFDENVMMISETILLKKVAGLSPEELMDGLRNRTCTPDTCVGWKRPSEEAGQGEVDEDEERTIPCEGLDHEHAMDPECMKAIAWLASRRTKGSETPKWSEFDFNLLAMDLEVVVTDEDLNELRDEESADPTSVQPEGEKT